jgi:hypothetical protein
MFSARVGDRSATGIRTCLSVRSSCRSPGIGFAGVARFPCAVSRNGGLPAAIVLPKVVTPDEIRRVHDLLSYAEGCAHELRDAGVGAFVRIQPLYDGTEQESPARVADSVLAQTESNLYVHM